MKISLRNFKCHELFELELPDVGLVKLEGESGKGKSSVNDAIMYALFGKGNPTTWGQTSSMVELNAGPTLDITRTRNPNLLQVCQTMTNASAQAYIETWLGMNQDEFEASSYVKQGHKNSLINMTPGDQLELITNLAMRGGVSPDDVKDFIKREISSADIRLQVIDGSREELLKQIVEAKLELEKFEKLIVGSTDLAERTEAVAAQKHQVSKLRNQLADSETSKAKLSHEKNILQSMLTDPARLHYQKAVDFVRESDPTILKLQEWFDNTSAVDYNEEWFKPKMFALNGVKHQVLTQIKHIAKINKMIANKTQLESLYDSNWKSLRDHCYELSIQDTPDEELARQAMASSEAFVSSAEAIGSIQASGEMVSDAHLVAQVSDIESQVKALMDEQLGALSEFKQYQAQALTLQETKARVEKAMKLIATNKSLRPEAELQASIVEVEAKLFALNESVHELRASLASDSSKYEAMEKELKYLTLYQNIKDKLAHLETRNVLSEAEHQLCTGNLAVLSKLLSLAQQASLDAIEAIVNDINARVSHWLEEIFDGDLKASLRTYKRLKSKDISDKMNLEIIYKGTDVKLDELSGGQQSRVMLAFQLALSELYNSPILILDEAMDGLDINSLEACIDAIKEIATQKLVLITEHAAPVEWFDEIIEV